MANEGRDGWAADFHFYWAPAAECKIITGVYDHYHCAFLRDSSGGEEDGVSLYEVIRQSAPEALIALAEGREATSRHRVIKVMSLGKPYAPLRDYPDLFLELAELGRILRDLEQPREIESRILAWVKKYGLLGVWGSAKAHRVYEEPAYVATPGLEPVEYFVAEAKRFAFLMDLYNALCNQDTDALQRYFKLEPDPGGKGQKVKVKGDPLYSIALPPAASRVPTREWWTPNDYLHYGLVYLVNTVGMYFSPYWGHWLHDVSPCIVEIKLGQADEEGEPFWEVERGWRCNTLLSAIYVQFYDFICRKRRAATCQWCGRWFVVRREGGKFCSDNCRGKAFYWSRKGLAEDTTCERSYVGKE